MRPRWCVAASIVALLALAASSAAGPPGQWTRLPGTVINFAEPGLARTPDGVLHVLYTRRNGSREDLIHVPVAPNGRVGGESVALGGWSAMSHPDLLRMPDGTLRAFFGGIRSTSAGETNNAMNTATAPASGSPWTLKPGRAAQALYAYATGVTGAGLARDGTPISTWSGSPGLGFHYGVDPVHFGVIMILNLGIGLNTPPVGAVQFVACAVAKIMQVDLPGVEEGRADVEIIPTCKAPIPVRRRPYRGRCIRCARCDATQVVGCAKWRSDHREAALADILDTALPRAHEAAPINGGRQIAHELLLWSDDPSIFEISRRSASPICCNLASVSR